jgi:hypothetical protein
LAPALECADDQPAAQVFAAHRLFGICLPVNTAIAAWSLRRRRVLLCFHVPTPRDLLALQARGWRHVSLLEPGAPTGRHETVLDFAIHDLCHLEKFYDPECHVEQVGIFAALHEAMGQPGWSELDARMDEAWAAERDYVAADMNGSAVFILLALKSRVRAAVRRKAGYHWARTAEEPASVASLVEEAHEQLYELMGLPPQVSAAARLLTARGAMEQAGQCLRNHFQERGAKALGRGEQSCTQP